MAPRVTIAPASPPLDPALRGLSHSSRRQLSDHRGSDGNNVKSTIFRKVALDRLSSPEELDQLSRITSPRAWLGLAAIAGLLLAVLAWSILATIPTFVEGEGALVESADDSGRLQAVLFTPIADAGKIRPGMEARVALASAPEEEFGYILGAVASVAELPADEEGLRRVLRNDVLVQSFIAQGAMVEVRVELLPDPDAAGSYRWSSPRGREVSPRPGTPLTGRVTVARQRPLRYVIP